MRAVGDQGTGERAWETVPKSVEPAATDAIVPVDVTTICGTFSIPELLDLMRGHQMKVGPFVTDQLALDEIEAAYDVNA